MSAHITTSWESRIRARLCAWRLDQALAQGAPPDSDPALSLRAHRLIGPVVRRGLAAELRALPRKAADACHPRDPRVPICRHAVLAAAELINELADQLAAYEAVDARGVAQVMVLMRDGQSPLFGPARADELGERIHDALEALEL
jgi:hypothetical protein